MPCGIPAGGEPGLVGKTTVIRAAQAQCFAAAVQSKDHSVAQMDGEQGAIFFIDGRCHQRAGQLVRQAAQLGCFTGKCLLCALQHSGAGRAQAGFAQHRELPDQQLRHG